MELAQKNDDKLWVGRSLRNIGNTIEDRDKALEYYTQSLKLANLVGDNEGISANLNNIGNYYLYNDEYDKSMEYYTSKLNLEEKLDNKHEIGLALNNFGKTYYVKGKKINEDNYDENNSSGDDHANQYKKFEEVEE